MIQKNNGADKGLKDEGRRKVKDIRAVLCPDSTGQKKNTKICSRLWTHLVTKNSYSITYDSNNNTKFLIMKTRVFHSKRKLM